MRARIVFDFYNDMKPRIYFHGEDDRVICESTINEEGGIYIELRIPNIEPEIYRKVYELSSEALKVLSKISKEINSEIDAVMERYTPSIEAIEENLNARLKGSER